MAEKYITIGRAAMILGLSVLTLRNYDKKGILSAKRDHKNDRVYNIEQVTAFKKNREPK